MLIQKSNKLKIILGLVALSFFLISCSNNEKLKSNKTSKASETTILEKQKQIKKDSLENLKKEILLLKKKKDSIMSKNKEILEQK